MPHVVIFGGSGFIGLSLARFLISQQYSITIVSRQRPATDLPLQWLAWDGRSLGDWVAHVDSATAWVNLAGRSVDCIKTPDHIDEILRSRVESTLVLGKALRQVSSPPPVWVQMSTAHRYGDSNHVVCDEDSPFGYGLAPHVGQAWEAAYAQSVLPNTRQVILRTSFVLGRDGGALPRMASLARWGLGGQIASGRQGISWIHEMDMNRLIFQAITDASWHGAYLATAPQPLPNAQFMKTLRQAIHMPIGLPAAAWMVRLGAPWLFKTDPELALYGRFCISKRLKGNHFSFLFPELAPALEDLYPHRAAIS